VVLGILGERDFFGEAALAGQALRMGSAFALTDCKILRIEKGGMIEALRRERGVFRQVCGVSAGAKSPL